MEAAQVVMGQGHGLGAEGMAISILILIDKA